MATVLGPPPVGGNQDRGPRILATLWAEWAIAFVVVAHRLWARVMIKKLGIDDWMMFFTLVRPAIRLNFSSQPSVLIGLLVPVLGQLYSNDFTYLQWGRKASLLLVPSSNLDRRQIQLDGTAIRYNWSWHWEDIDRFLAASTHGAQDGVAEVVHLFDHSDHYHRHDRSEHNHLHTVQSIARTLGTSTRFEMLGS